MVQGSRLMIKEIVKGMWQFARFLFVPQNRPKDYYNL